MFQINLNFGVGGGASRGNTTVVQRRAINIASTSMANLWANIIGFLGVLAVIYIIQAYLASNQADYWCTEVERGSIVILQPSTEPRLGGSFSVYGLDGSMFSVKHLIQTCQSIDSAEPGKQCDLLWIDGKLPPPSSRSEGQFTVQYRSADGLPYWIKVSYGTYVCHSHKEIEYKLHAGQKSESYHESHYRGGGVIISSLNANTLVGEVS